MQGTEGGKGRAGGGGCHEAYTMSRWLGVGCRAGRPEGAGGPRLSGSAAPAPPFPLPHSLSLPSSLPRAFLSRPLPCARCQEEAGDDAPEVVTLGDRWAAHTHTHTHTHTQLRVAGVARCAAASSKGEPQTSVTSTKVASHFIASPESRTRYTPATRGRERRAVSLAALTLRKTPPPSARLLPLFLLLPGKGTQPPASPPPNSRVASRHARSGRATVQWRGRREGRGAARHCAARCNGAVCRLFVARP